MKTEPRYTYDFDIVFSVHTDRYDWLFTTGETLREALQQRLDSMTDEELEEACGFLNEIDHHEYL